jgi:hypothetical protein
LLGPLAWDHFPERNLEVIHGFPAIPFTPFVAACLVKLDRQLPYMSHLRQYLVEHPALTWLVGFPLVPSRCYSCGFDVEASLTSARHFTRMLGRVPNDSLQWLLDKTVHRLQAELTQPFDQPDVSYFFPLMADRERRLSFRPKFGAFDAAFEAICIYEHFHREGQDRTAGFVAVPFSQRGGHHKMFSADGLPLCQAGLPIPLKYTFASRTGFFPHQCNCYACPLPISDLPADACPVNHKRWSKGSCTTTRAASIGARIRYQIDRDSNLFKEIYKQRTATEGINSQSVFLMVLLPGSFLSPVNGTVDPSYWIYRIPSRQSVVLRSSPVGLP